MNGILVDESLSRALAEAIRKGSLGVPVRRIGDGMAPVRGTPDPDILLWIEANDFVLVTDNRGSMPVHLAHHLEAGRHVPGIIQVPREYSFGELAEQVELVYGASITGELVDRITHVHVDEQP